MPSLCRYRNTPKRPAPRRSNTWVAAHWTFNCKKGQMSFLGWIVLDLLAGLLGTEWQQTRRGPDARLSLLGRVGAVVEGCLFSTFGASGVSGLNLYSLP